MTAALLAVVRWIDPEDVGEWLVGLALAAGALFGLALMASGANKRDLAGFLARLSMLCVIPFLTLCLSSL